MIAGITEQSTNPPGSMTMVHCKMPSRSDFERVSLTNETNASLLLKDRRVILFGEAILFFNPLPALG